MSEQVRTVSFITTRAQNVTSGFERQNQKSMLMSDLKIYDVMRAAEKNASIKLERSKDKVSSQEVLLSFGFR